MPVLDFKMCFNTKSEVGGHKNLVYNKDFDDRCMSAEDAVKLVNSGDTVYIGTCSSMAYALCDALHQRRHELENITVACSQIIRSMPLLDAPDTCVTKINTYFMGVQERNARSKQRQTVLYSSVHLSQVDIWCRATAPDVSFFEVSCPDENGYMSFGATGVALHAYLKESSRKIILQINRNVPFAYGEQNTIHFSEADAIVFADGELYGVEELGFGSDIAAISDFILEQIPDGACIQLGIGGVANAVGHGLKAKNDLGIHTEMMSTSMMELMKAGVVTNKYKNYYPGKSVSAFTFGTPELYRFIDHNPDMYYLPFPIVNDPVNIAKNDNMISINTAISLDLFGQVNADNIAGRQHSGTGGQVDFVRGAQMSKGGKSFIAIPSTVENSKLGRQSRIVFRFPEGTAVTTPRSDVQFVVTEYGCVNLKPLTMPDRIRAMISLAHPNFRDELTQDAKAAGLL